jgi:hypothetical protein
VICLALTAPAFAGMYKWTDKDGKIHFTDSLSKVPLDQRNKKRIRKMESTKIDPVNSPAVSHTAPKHLGAGHEGSHSKNTGVDQQRVKDLLRLNQKKHYGHK